MEAMPRRRCGMEYHDLVEEKFPQEKIRVLSEMRIVVKIRMGFLDFVGYVEILMKFRAKLDFWFGV